MSYIFWKLCDQGRLWHRKNDVRGWFKAARNFFFLRTQTGPWSDIASYVYYRATYNTVFQAMAYITEKVPCIKFKPKSNLAKDFVTIYDQPSDMIPDYSKFSGKTFLVFPDDDAISISEAFPRGDYLSLKTKNFPWAQKPFPNT